MINKTNIGKIIQKLRKDKNLTQEELAEKIDLSTNYLSKVERGLSVLNVEAFLKMADVLNFTLDDFGVNTDSRIDETKKELVKRILSSSEKEIKAYTELLDTMQSIVKTLRKKYTILKIVIFCVVYIFNFYKKYYKIFYDFYNK